MTNKKIVVGLALIIAVGVAGYFFFPGALSRSVNTDLDSIENVETGSTSDQAKIDIAAVCNGALAYMSFPDGASAEVFLRDCREGKHPEVIEQWKIQMGIGSDVAI